MFKTIAWTTDCSPSALKAMTVAKDLAQNTGAKLVVLHVHEVGIDRFGHLDDANDHALQALDRTVAQLCENGIEAQLATGRAPAGGAHRTILEIARDKDVDLLVVGNRGHGPLTGLLVGSVAMQLLQSARYPVLMVPSRNKPNH